MLQKSLNKLLNWACDPNSLPHRISKNLAGVAQEYDEKFINSEEIILFVEENLALILTKWKYVII